MYLIQGARSRDRALYQKEDTDKLVKLAEDAQVQLAEATKYHAPGLRYGAILETLQQEAHIRLRERAHDGSFNDQAEAAGPVSITVDPTTGIQHHGEVENFAVPMDMSGLDSMSDFMETDFLDLDFWSYLEAIPFNEQWQEL